MLCERSEPKHVGRVGKGNPCIFNLRLPFRTVNPEPAAIIPEKLLIFFL